VVSKPVEDGQKRFPRTQGNLSGERSGEVNRQIAKAIVAPLGANKQTTSTPADPSVGFTAEGGGQNAEYECEDNSAG
jgi:hypothetical protein